MIITTNSNYFRKQRQPENNFSEECVRFLQRPHLIVVLCNLGRGTEVLNIFTLKDLDL